MSYTDTAIQAVAAAERSLRDVLQAAVAAQAYRDVAIIAVAADALAKTLRDLGAGDVTTTATDSVNGADDAASRRAIELQTTAPGTRRAGRARVVISNQRGIYPQFLRDGESLVKIAWSKSKRKPYEHRAPKVILEDLIAAIRKGKGEGKLFEAANVLPLTNGNGEEYPSYQSYLALMWLRHVGLIAKRGRSGYVLKSGTATAENIERLWTALGTAE
jgi:hypothetical protein